MGGREVGPLRDPDGPPDGLPRPDPLGLRTEGPRDGARNQLPMPTARRGFVLQPRDGAVLVALSRFGCLTSHQLHMLLFGGARPQVSRRRLLGLRRLGLVRRYRLPRELVGLPTGHAIYVLTARGAGQLEEPQRVRPVALGTLLHDLGTNQVLLQLGRELGAEVVPEPMLRRKLAEARRAGGVPRGMCVPDGALETPAGALYLEYVRTAPRGGLGTLRRKFQRYLALQRTGTFARVYGHRRVRAVLVLSTAPGRSQHLAAASAQLRRGAGFFLFAATDADGRAPAVWLTSQGESRPLTELIR